MRRQTSILTATEARALETKLVNIRILVHLLVFGPTDIIREHIAKAVLTDKNRGSDALVSRGAFYDKLFLRTCKVSLSHHLKGQTKTPLGFSSFAIILQSHTHRGCEDDQTVTYQPPGGQEKCKLYRHSFFLHGV